MKASVYYTRKNVSGFEYDGTDNPRVEVRHYDNDGEFIKRTTEYIDLNKHFVKVAEVELEEDPKGDLPSEALNGIYRRFNIFDMPSKITEGIKSGELDTSHSSMSVGDIIEIDGNFYSVERYGFGRTVGYITNNR